jgi:ABC-type antimicrobial peptide transport system permease subunit
VRAALLGMDPRIRFANVAPLAEQLIDPQLRSWRLGATMFTLFGALALLVAALGLYSVLAFDVAQRTREIGLRSALGANTGVLLAMVVRSAARMTGIGVAAGLVAALLLAPRLQELLYHTSPRDPVTLGTVALVLLIVSLAASCVPAWRAARVDPIVALRAD